MDWIALAKWAGPVIGGVIAGRLWPVARRAIRNRGKTEQEIASEDLDRAFRNAEEKHKNTNPNDDAAADAAVDAARKRLNDIRRSRAIWDGLTEDTPPPKG